MSLALALLLALQEPVLPPTVVVAPRATGTLTRSEAFVTVVEAEQLARTGRRSLPAAIAAATGVWLQETNLGGGSPFVRGLTGNQILILVDGVRINDATTRFGPNQSLNTIDPAIVERVEITRGPSSVLYGSDAIGGVVSIWTKRRAPAGDEADDAGLRTSLDLDLRSAARGGTAAASASQAWNDDALLLGGSLFDFDDLAAARGTVEFTGYDGHALFAAWEHDLGDGRSLRSTAALHRDFDVPRTDKLIPGFGQTTPSSAVYRFALQDRQRYLVAYTDDDPGLGERLQARFSFRRYVEEREKQQTGSTTFTDERDAVDTFGLGIDLQRALGDDHLLTVGFDVENDTVDSARTDTETTTGAKTPKNGQFAPDARYTRAGAFVQDETTAFDAVDLTAGLRWSYYDFGFDRLTAGGREHGSFDALTASVQAARDLTTNTRLTAGLAQGYRAPNLDDLAKDGSFGGGTELANPDLVPERSLTAELGVETRRERWSGTLAAFWTEIDDVVGRVLQDEGSPTTTGDETYLRENVGRVRLYGFEAGGVVAVGRQDSPFRLAGNAAWTLGRQFDDTFDVSSGTRPFDDVPWRRVPPLHGRLALEFAALERRTLEWGTVELLAAAEQDQLHPEDLTDPRIDPNGTAGWALVNLDLGGTFGARRRGRWNAGIHNLFDAAYRVHGSGFDGPGLSLVVGLGWGG